MKKLFALLVGMSIAVICFASAEDVSFSLLVGSYYLSSGVGAWHTDVYISADGSFEGMYQDTDMDEGELDGVSYEATRYICSFSGQLSKLQQVTQTELSAKVTGLIWEQGEPYVEDGVLYVPTQPGGFSENAELRFFLKGTSIEELPEEFLLWVRMREVQITWSELPDTSFYNVTDDAGFSGAEPQQDFLMPEQPYSEEEEPVDIVSQTPVAEEMPEQEGIEFPVEAKVVNCQSYVTLRANPSTKADSLAQIPVGGKVLVCSNTPYYGNDRCFVKTVFGDLQGYVCLDYLDVILPEYLNYQTEYLHDAAGTVSAVNPGTDLLMRIGPGTDKGILGLMFGGEVLGYKGDAQRDSDGMCWYHCSHYGEDCWIAAKYTVLTLNDGTTYTGARGLF